MKFFPALLLNVLVVGAGILIYDALRPGADATGTRALHGDAPLDAPATGLRGSAEEARAHASEARLHAMEQAIARLQAELEQMRTGKRVTPPQATETEGEVRIDERTLAWLSAYRQEMLEREGEQRRRERLAEELRRKGVELSDELMERVVQEVLAFHARAAELMRKPFERSAEGHAERARAVRELREGFAALLQRIVPTDQAERILATRMGRARDVLPADED